MTFSEQLKLSQELECARSKEFYWSNRVHTLVQSHPRDSITFELPNEVKSTEVYQKHLEAQAYVQECKDKLQLLIETKGFNEEQLKRKGLL